MSEVQTQKKRLRTQLIVLFVIIVPMIFRIWDSNALANIRSVDGVMLFFLGFATGVFVINLKNYLTLKNKQ